MSSRLTKSNPQRPRINASLSEAECRSKSMPQNRVSKLDLNSIGPNSFPSHLTFEGLFETQPEELKELRAIKLLDIKYFRHLQSDVNENMMSRRLTLAEQFANFFGCCEIAVANDMCQRVKTLFYKSPNRSMVIRFTRTASFLRRNIVDKGQIIGSGSLSRVFLCKIPYGNEPYALKKVLINTPQNADKSLIHKYMEQQAQNVREKDIMLLTDHAFCCKLVACWVQILKKQKLSYRFLLEYAPFGSLAQFIKQKFHRTMSRNFHEVSSTKYLQQIKRHTANVSKENVPVNLNKRKKLIYIYATEMATALDYLHNARIVHRDFKPSNILIDANYHLLVADYGFANTNKAYHSFNFDSFDYSLVDHPEMVNDPMENIVLEDFRSGTFAYCYPPEFLNMKMVDNHRFFPMDMWALGVTLFELYTGVQPFSGSIPRKCSEYRVLSRAITHWRDNRVLTRPLYPKIVDDDGYRDLLSKLICEMQNRLSSAEALGILTQKTTRLVGKSIKEIKKSKLEFMIDAFQSKLASKD